MWKLHTCVYSEFVSCTDLTNLHLSHRFKTRKSSTEIIFDILKDDEYEAQQLSSDAIFLSILVDQEAGKRSGRNDYTPFPWDQTNDPAYYYTLLKEFLIDPARAGPHFF